MSKIDELDNWKYMLEQAKEYDLVFDKAIVSDMVETIEEQQKEIKTLKVEFEKIYDDWALGNYLDERQIFFEMRDMIHKFKKSY